MSELNLKEIRSLEAQSTTFDDVVGENKVRVYPYRMVNATNDKVMFKPDCLSVIAISNEKTNFDESKTSLKSDESGYNYFEILLDPELNGDITTHLLTSSIGNQYKEIPTFMGITNEWNEVNLVKPCVFFVGKPFSKELFEKDEQQAYIASNIKFGGPELQDNVISDFEETFKSVEIQFDNLRILETAFPNSTVKLTTNTNLNKANDILMYLPTSGLIPLGGIKLRGEYAKLDDDGNEIYTNYGDIDVQSLEKWVPFKMTPTSVADKVTMYADWFDYDSVLPFVYANKFNAGAGLETVITNEDDRKMVEDMLSISAGFAENWKKAPVLTSGSDAGKIDPSYRVGHKGIKITTIAGMDPIKVVDGIYEDHIREHPAFLTDISRYQPAKEIINALSRYIYSSYSIGKGLNSFNQAYLPWYLEPSVSTPIKFGKSESIVNPDYGSTGNVTTYVLNDGIKFQVKTLYFTNKFTDKVPYAGQSTPTVPTGINFSTQVMLQTDRKLTLPEVPRVISAIDKLPLPGDINTNSSIDLSYIWMLPIQEQAKFEEFMLNSLTDHTPVPVNTDITVNIPTTAPGDIWTQAMADAYALKQVPGTIKTHSVLTQVESNISAGHTIKTRSGRGGGEIIIDGHSLNGLSGLGPFDPNQALNMFNHILAQFGIHDHGEKYFLIDANGNKIAQGSTGVLGGTFRLVTYKTEFTPTVVTTTSATGATSYSFQGREVLFDKEQWENFLNDFNIVPKGENTVVLSGRNDKIRIKKVEEIIIKSMWADKAKILLGGSFDAVLEVDMINRDDETITIQRVLLV